MSLEHPYTDLHNGQWLVGSLHAHGDHTAAGQPHQVLLDSYAKLGYDFVMIAEHDKYTTAKQLAALDSRGIILIPGCELTVGPHLLHVGPADAPPMYEQAQLLLDRAHDHGEIVVAAHPNWGRSFDHISFEQMRDWKHLTGLEIYSGLIERIDGSAYAVDKWDRLLSAGVRLWGFADDDSFKPTDMHRGWNVVYAKERSIMGVVDALRAGRFYASNGLTIGDIRVDNRTIYVKSPDAQRIVVVTEYGRRVAVSDGNSIEFTIPASLQNYVRIECHGSAERKAWTQPFFLALYK